MKSKSNFDCIGHGRSAAVVLTLLGCFAGSLAAQAAPVVLEKLEYRSAAPERGTDRGTEWKLDVYFSIPLHALRHSPDRNGSSVEVALEPLGNIDLLELLGSRPEVLRPPKQADLPLRDVRMELGADDRPVLLLRFWRDVAFRIEPGADFRSLTFHVRKRTAGPKSPATAPSVASDGATDEIMEEARAAMVAHEYDRAISLYTLVMRSVSQQPQMHEREALEYLGLARQRNGQLAHARAEYEDYLARFPEGEGSDRVRQRLAALTTATAAAPEKLEATPPRTPTEFDFFGSLYTAYFRTESFADLSGAELVDSSQLLDADVSGRMRRGDLEMRGRASGYLRYDYDAGASETPSRVTRLYLEARERHLQLGGILGRQSSRGGGVLGRLDGLTADWSPTPDWTLEAVAGFPLVSSVSNKVNTDEQVYGISVEGRELVPGLSSELYAVGQFIDGTTDRAAIGLETRYVGERRSAYGLLDFDFYFAELNLAMFSGNWRITDATSLNMLVDYRYSPFLTTRNALIGQPFEDLGDLEDTLADDQIKELAKDRTPRVTTLVAGASHRINEELEITGDFTASQIGKTRSSGGVPGYDSSSWFFYYTAQLIRWNGWMEGGTERLGLRFFDGDRYDSFSTLLSGRYPLPYEFRLTPELRFEYRRNRDSRDFIELDPGLRLEYRFRWLVLDTDFAFQWIKRVGSGGSSTQSDELGYLLNVGLRYDF